MPTESSPVRWIEDTHDLAPRSITGIVIANELLDALPVRRVIRAGGQWIELGVSESDAHALGWSGRQITRDDPLAAAAAALPDERPDGFVTEIHFAAATWTETLVSRLAPGSTAVLIDYGLDAQAYFSRSRPQGTLRAIAAHRHRSSPLDNPGAADLTAHVNWTPIEAAARRGGAETVPIADQAAYLTRLAEPWLRQLESDPEALIAAAPLLRQFQTLTHPAMMGQKFQVLELAPTLD